MAVNITDADAYIRAQCLDVEDWIDSDEERKTRLLNVAERTMTKRFPEYIIPENAVYEFANVLSVKFNDTNKNAQNGVAGFSVAGISYQFKEVGGTKDLALLMTQAVVDLIGEANGGITLRVRRIGRGVR
jgi:hypothetical protein